MTAPSSQSKSLALSTGTAQASKTSSSSSGASSSTNQLVSVGLNNILDITRSIRLPKPYYLKTEGDFKIWVRHLEQYFTLLNVSDEKKTTLLLYNLGKEASDTAYYLGITDNTNYDNAKNLLMQYFSPVETPEELRTYFHQRYQVQNETLEHFAMELRVLCSKAYPAMNPAELDEMSKQQFILGVQNSITREHLIIQRPTKLKDAIEYGRLLEVANKTARSSLHYKDTEMAEATLEENDDFEHEEINEEL